MTNSYKGKVLIFTPDSSSDIFSRSVILIIEHNESGAFGLILNKLNKNMVGKLDDLFGMKIKVYEGGPVMQDNFFFIIKGSQHSDSDIAINDHYYMSGNIDRILSGIDNDTISIDDIKVFSGYSGWSPNQLETEIDNKMWTVLNILNLDYTDESDETLWKKIMQSLGGEYLIWANTPEDISLN